MNAEKFTYWLQGFAELNEYPPNVEQWQVIRDHLALVFEKVTPERDNAFHDAEKRKDANKAAQLHHWRMVQPPIEASPTVQVPPHKPSVTC